VLLGLGSLAPVSEVAERYRRVADGFAARLGGVAEDQWSAPSPCPDWSARDVAEHVVSVHQAVVGTVGAAPGGEDGDLIARWASVNATVSEILADPASASRRVSGRFGEQTFESLVSRLVCSDLLVHTWDLARATDQDDRLDAAAAAAAYELLQPLDTTARVPGGFGPRVTAPPGADAQTLLLTFCGRTP
jgi:uncharacterized protein (TIGR03086 family)